MAVFQSTMVLQAAARLTGGAVSNMLFLIIHTSQFNQKKCQDNEEYLSMTVTQSLSIYNVIYPVDAHCFYKHITYS
jgi:hypothetical protein